MLKSRLFALGAVLCFVLLFSGVRVLAQTAADQDLAADAAVEQAAESAAAEPAAAEQKEE